MTRTDVDEARCEALFASTLQCSGTPTPDMVAEAIRSALRRLGRAGCAAPMAQEFGDHPEQAGPIGSSASNGSHCRIGGHVTLTTSPAGTPHESRQAPPTPRRRYKKSSAERLRG